MSNTKYSYSWLSDYYRVLFLIFVLIVIVFFYCLIKFGNSHILYALEGLICCFGAVGGLLLKYYSWIEIDDESCILVFHCLGKSRIDIGRIDTITRHIKSDGRLRYLKIHEAGVKYCDIFVNAKDEQALLAHITRLNQKITVSTKERR